MDERFTQLVATFINGVLTPIAQYAKTNAEAIKSAPVEDIVTAFRRAGGIPTVSAAPASLAALPPAIGGAAIPAGMAGLTVGGAAKPKRAAGGSSKAAKDQQRWLTIEQYRSEYHGRQPVCAYMPNRGNDLTKKGHVCGAPAVNTDSEPNQLKWRCVACSDKKGEIEKKFGPAQGAAKAVVSQAFNLPTGAGGSGLVVPPPPQLPGATPMSQFPPGMMPLPGAMPGPGSLGAPKLPGAPPRLPLDLSTGSSQLPGIGLPGISLPPQQPIALPGVPSDKKDLAVIQNRHLDNVFFVDDMKYRQLAVMGLDDDNLVCIGKVTFGIPDEDSLIPTNWAETLTEPSAEDFAFLKDHDVRYSFKNESAAKEIP